jgi:hypothetical protein
MPQASVICAFAPFAAVKVAWFPPSNVRSIER